MASLEDVPKRVRVICLTDDGQVLLLRWQDPIDAHIVWEPPGGGIEAGETPGEAATRELREETGLRLTSSDEGSLLVRRDVLWAGVRHQHVEAFFVTRLHAPVTIETGLHTETEQREFTGHRWVDTARFADLDGTVEPSTLAEMVAELASDRQSP
ncbi:MAG: NUDIX domain-containing protein [Candidatus Dormibacter sp.]